MIQLLLDNSLLIVAGAYSLHHFIRYYGTKYAVIDTDRVQTAYFNILWSRKK